MREPEHRVSGLLKEHLNQHSSSAFAASGQPSDSDYTASERLSAKLFAKLELFGLDIVAPLALDWYNSSLVLTGTPAKIPPSGKAGGQALALLVGNTKHIWEPFLAACMEHPQLLELADPLDAYVERSVEAVLLDSLPTGSCRVFYGHQKSPELVGGEVGSSGYIALQRMAQAAGIAFLDEESHLCMHPKYGPWFALRAVLVFDGIRHTGEQPRQLNSPLDPITRHYIRLAIKGANRSSSDLSVSPSDFSQTMFGSPEHRLAIPVPGSAAPPSPPPLLGPEVRVHLQHIQQQQHKPQGKSPADEADKKREADGSHHSNTISGCGTSGQLASAGSDSWPLRVPSSGSIRAQWHKWVAIRDAPCAGHPWRYPKHQLTYHYTGDRNVLRRLISAASLPPDAAERRAVEAEVSSPTARRWRSVSNDHLSSACSSDRRRSMDAPDRCGGGWSSLRSSHGGDASPKRVREQEPSAESSTVHGSSSSSGIRNSSSLPSLYRPHNQPQSAVFAPRATPGQLHSPRARSRASIDRPNRLSISSRPGSSGANGWGEASTTSAPSPPCPATADGLANSDSCSSNTALSHYSNVASMAQPASDCDVSFRSHMRRKGMSTQLLEASPPTSDEDESEPRASQVQYNPACNPANIAEQPSS